jgi:phage-related protein
MSPLFKPVKWIGSSRSDLRQFPEDVQQDIGFALYQAQLGRKHLDTKPLKGFKGAGVLEIVEDFNGDTYRAIYTVRFEEIIYVLHVFQKKSKRGIETTKRDMDLVESRLKRAREEYAIYLQQKQQGEENE